MPNGSAKPSVIDDYAELRKEWVSDPSLGDIGDLAVLVAAQHIVDAVNRLARHLSSLETAIKNK